MSYASSYCLFRTKDRPGIVQPSLRDFGYLLPNPTLERVGYSQVSHPGDRCGLFSNLLSGRYQSEASSVKTAHGRKMSTLQVTLRSESSSPDTEMVPPKTAENQSSPTKAHINEGLK